jgi:hypothetical protein
MAGFEIPLSGLVFGGLESFFQNRINDFCRLRSWHVKNLVQEVVLYCGFRPQVVKNFNARMHRGDLAYRENRATRSNDEQDIPITQ